MSQPENEVAVVSLDQQLVHIKAIEIDFADKRPRYPIFVEFKVKGEHTLTSPRFGKDGLVCWGLKDYQHIPVTTDFSIVVQEVHSLKRKKVSSTFEVKSQDTIGKDNFTVVATGKGRAQLKLSCISVSPTDAFTELLVKEAQALLGKKKVLLESLGKTADILAGFMKFADVASDVHPAAKAAVIAVNALYERCKLQKECHTAAVELMEDLGSFLPYTKDVPQDFVENGRTRQMVTQMLDIFCQISRLVIEYSSDGVLGDLLSSHKEKIDSSKNDFKRLKENYDWYIKMEVWRSALRTERNTERIEKGVNDLLLRELQPARRAYYNVDKVCPEGKNMAVLGWVRDWAESDSKILWLHGEAGPERSSIVHSVAHMFKQQGRLPGCFFCSGDDVDCCDPLKVLPTLAYHFSKLYMAYRSHLVTVIQGEDEMKLTKSVKWQSELLLEQPLAFLSVTPPSSLVIVIDALDECDNGQGSGAYVARILLQLADSTPWLKVFIAGRPLPSLQQVFLPSTMRIATLDNDIEDEHDTVVSILSQTLGANPEAKLDQVYTFLVQGAFETVGNAQIVQAVLSVIACTSTTRQLSNKEIMSFMHAAGWVISSGLLNTIVDSLQAVLYKDISKGESICVHYPSFSNFVYNQSQECWAVSGEPIMARECLKIMISELKFNICGLESSHVANDDISDLENRVTQCISLELQYSCLYWMKHLSSCNLNVNEQSLQDLLSGFLHGPRVLYWLECLSMMRELKSGIDILVQCTEYFKKSSKAFAICTELHELVSTCYSAIAISTPHLYISALSWAAADGLIVKQFYQCFSNQCFTGSVRDEHTDDAAGGALTGHSSQVNSVAYSPDGRHIVSGSADMTIRIWDTHTGKAVGEPLTGHSHWVKSVAYSPDGRHIVSGSDEWTLRIWDTETRKAVGEPLTGHSHWVWSVAYSPDGKHIVSGSSDRTLRIWDIYTGKAVGEPLTGHSDYIRSVAYSPDGRHIVSGSDDYTLRIWDAHTRKPVGEPLTGHSHWVWSIAYSPDGKHIASGSSDRTLRIWDAHIRKAVGESLTADMTIRIWDTHTGKAVGESLTGHSHWVKSVAYSPDGRHIVSGSEDNSLRIWDPSTFSASLLQNVRKEISDDGWLRDTEGHLLLWVPHKYHSHILGVTTACKITISLAGHGNAVQVDWNKLFEYSGTSWVNIFKNES
ncbi:hypothetical protein M0805_003363 [Coniferiporia weirii]|nr:hypothetical protein M0805_003363 [Coniferiporia weirii]